MRDTRQPDELERRITDGDGGYTLIEMILVILVLGILTTVVVVAVSGMRTEAADSGCDSDRRLLGTAAEAYFAHTGDAQIAATGAGHDRYERTLVTGGYLRAASTYHDLDADGIITAQGGSSC